MREKLGNGDETRGKRKEKRERERHLLLVELRIVHVLIARLALSEVVIPVSLHGSMLTHYVASTGSNARNRCANKVTMRANKVS